MAQIFGRQQELIFGVPLRLDATTFTPAVSPPLKLQQFDDVINVPNAVRLTDHNIRFELIKTKKEATNEGFIEVFNMTDQTRQYLENIQSEKPVVEYKAGYIGRVKSLWRGQVESVYDTFQGDTRVTRIILTDGAENMREATSARYWAPGTSVDQIVSDLLDDLGLPKAANGVVPLGEEIQLRKALYASGSTIDALRSVGINYNALLSVIDMTSYFVPETRSLDSIIPSGNPISEDNGLIGNVVLDDTTAGQSRFNSSKPKKSVKFKTFLNGALIPFARIELDDRFFSGPYRISEVKHVGELEGREWHTECTAEEIDG